MHIYKAKELRSKQVNELFELLKKEREELVKLLMKIKARMVVEKPSEIRNRKRNIARILTVLREKGIKA